MKTSISIGETMVAVEELDNGDVRVSVESSNPSKTIVELLNVGIPGFWGPDDCFTLEDYTMRTTQSLQESIDRHGGSCYTNREHTQGDIDM